MNIITTNIEMHTCFNETNGINMEVDKSRIHPELD